MTREGEVRLLSVLLAALLGFVGSGCSGSRSAAPPAQTRDRAGANEVRSAWRTLTNNLSMVPTGEKLGEFDIVPGTCVIAYPSAGRSRPAVTDGADLVSPDGRVYITVYTYYSMEYHAAWRLSRCLQIVRNALNW